MRTALGLIVIVAILLIVVILLLRRRSSDEIHSIDNYRHALDTLQEMRTHSSGSVRVLGEDEARELRQPHLDAEIGVVSARTTPRSSPGEPLVFNDDAPSSDLTAPVVPADDGRGHGRSSWAMERMQSAPRVNSRQIVVAGIAIAVVVILIIVGSLIGSSSTSKHAATTTTTVQHHKHPTTTTTTSPPVTRPPTSYQPQSSTATSATYQVTSSTFTVIVTATSGPCWTIVTSADGSSQLFAGTVQPGSPQSIKATGPISVSLGAPAAVSVNVGKIPVVFPSGYQAPLVLTFQPPTSATTTTVAPTTTTAP